jgi:hypothetical protein
VATLTLTLTLIHFFDFFDFFDIKHINDVTRFQGPRARSGNALA